MRHPQDFDRIHLLILLLHCLRHQAILSGITAPERKALSVSFCYVSSSQMCFNYPLSQLLWSPFEREASHFAVGLPSSQKNSRVRHLCIDERFLCLLIQWLPQLSVHSFRTLKIFHLCNVYFSVQWLHLREQERDFARHVLNARFQHS